MTNRQKDLSQIVLVLTAGQYSVLITSTPQNPFVSQMLIPGSQALQSLLNSTLLKRTGLVW